MQANIKASQWVRKSLVGLLLVALAVSALAQSSDLSPAAQSKRVLVVSVPDRKLTVVEDGNVIATFAVAVGAPATPSPSGEFRIVNRLTNPTYYRPGTVIPTGKDNPIGTRWLGLDKKGYGIHGTNAPKSVGRSASHGCIRLRNRDMERLFSLVRIGDRVEIHAARDDQIARFFGIADHEEIAGATNVPTQSGGQ